MKFPTVLKATMLLFIIMFTLTGCIITSLFAVYHYRINQSDIKSLNSFQYITASLEDSTGYRADEIHNVGFELWLSNSDTIVGEIRIYISQPFDTIPFDASFIRSNLIPVYNGATILSGNQVFVPWVTSIPRVVNHQKFFSYIKDGQFNLYFVPYPPGAMITLDSANLIISASVYDLLHE